MVTAARVLVTGAGGFVCSEIAVVLGAAGHAVTATDRIFDPAARARLSDVQLIDGDLSEILPEVMSTLPDTVIHGAAITADPARLGLSRAAHIRRNMELLTGTFGLAREAGARRFVFLSSMGVFGPDDAPSTDGRFTEATVPSARCPYAAAKRAGEIVTQAAAEDGFATLSLRLGNIFGPHEAVRETRQHLCLAARMIAEARATGVITVATPQARREWAWLPDLAGLIARLTVALPVDTPPVLNAGTPPVIADLDLARLVAERLPGTTIRLAPAPHPRIRPPMGSRHQDVLGPTVWTGMDEALGHLIGKGVPA